MKQRRQFFTSDMNASPMVNTVTFKYWNTSLLEGEPAEAENRYKINLLHIAFSSEFEMEQM